MKKKKSMLLRWYTFSSLYRRRCDLRWKSCSGILAIIETQKLWCVGLPKKSGFQVPTRNQSWCWTQFEHGFSSFVPKLFCHIWWFFYVPPERRRCWSTSLWKSIKGGKVSVNPLLFHEFSKTTRISGTLTNRNSKASLDHWTTAVAVLLLYSSLVAFHSGINSEKSAI